MSRYSYNKTAITLSRDYVIAAVEQNPTFADCTMNARATQCATTLNQGLILLDSGSVQLSGTPAAPQLYDGSFARCAGPASPTCGIEVITTFSADCGPTLPPPLSTCPFSQVQNVTITYVVQQSPLVPQLQSGANLKPFTGTFLVPVPITNPTGTANTLARWDGGGNFADSIVTQVGGRIGINRAGPLTNLHVGGDAWIDNNSGDTQSRAIGLTVSSLPTANYVDGADPLDTLRTLSMISKGATRPSIMTLRNLDYWTRWWDIILDPNDGGKLKFSHTGWGGQIRR